MDFLTVSVRERVCVAGSRQLFAYVDKSGGAYRKYGKLIVATSEREVEKIEAIYATGQRNGVEGLELVSATTAKAWEPQLACTAALWSPETGVVDGHGYMLALRGEMEDHGGGRALKEKVQRGKPLAGGGFRVATGGAEAATLTCRRVVNSGGLHAQRVARSVDGFPVEHIPQLVLAKGSYFVCGGRQAFSRLVYPAPVDGGLGVHVTLDLGGRMKFGPDVEWLASDDPDSIDYTVDPRRANSFYDAIRRYWPGLPDGALTPDYLGCRPKLSGPGELAADFRIDGPELHGVTGLVNLFGIESPGLTSSLAIADEVRARLAD